MRPADTATTGTASVYLSTTETARIHAAKTAHALWLDKEARLPWRLADVLKPLTSEVVTISDPVVQPRRFFRILTPAP